MYAWGPQYEIKLGPAKPSPIPDLLEIPVTVALQGQSDTAVVYVTKDAKFIFRGELTDMTVDPLAETRSKLHPGNSPSLGPADAKITLIEFADFECPSCRQLDRILRDLLPQHPEIRLVYKDFPLTTIHPWAMTASLAGQCAIQQNPSSFWKIHDIIFDAQDLITPSNVWDKMSDFANQIGLNAETFRACMANPDTAQEVEKTTAEGHELNITGTPTIFVNGRRIVGPDESILKQFIDFEALLRTKHSIAYTSFFVKRHGDVATLQRPRAVSNASPAFLSISLVGEPRLARTRDLYSAHRDLQRPFTDCNRRFTRVPCQTETFNDSHAGIWTASAASRTRGSSAATVSCSGRDAVSTSPSPAPAQFWRGQGSAASNSGMECRDLL